MAVIGFSPAPSAVIFAMMAMDKGQRGGLRFSCALPRAQRGIAAAVVAMALGSSCIPVLDRGEARHPAASLRLSDRDRLTTYRLARRVRSQNQTLAALSSIDGLSRLLNRSHWESVVAGEFHRCRRIGHPSS